MIKILRALVIFFCVILAACESSIVLENPTVLAESLAGIQVTHVNVHNEALIVHGFGFGPNITKVVVVIDEVEHGFSIQEFNSTSMLLHANQHTALVIGTTFDLVMSDG